MSMSLERFNIESLMFKRLMPSSLGVGECYDFRSSHSKIGLVVRIGTQEYFVSDEVKNQQLAIEDIAEFHLRRYPHKPLWKAPTRRPKK